jgi:SAM-dependent methyltransferase/uncharacterized protein YbaR (Trm112 family)
MNERMVELLACPVCRGAVRLEDPVRSAGGEIAEGALRCAGCGAAYPIAAGVPRLNPPGEGATEQARVGEHFFLEFSTLAEEDQDFDPPDVLEYVLVSRTGIDPLVYSRIPGDLYRTSVPTGPDAYRPDSSFLRGKRVLDAGCGGGRLTPVAARHADHIVGLEYGPHVDRAAARCRGLENVDIVQGSVLDPPFRDGVFDFAFSVGVLHHTTDPAAACRELARVIAEDGALSVWVYPPQYWGGRVREPVNRAIHRVLSRLEPRRALSVCRWVLYPLGRLQMALARRPWTKWAAAPVFVVSVPRHPRREVMLTTIFDYFGPPIISTHTYEEVAGWLRAAGFKSLRQLPVPSAWFAEGR